ncbi:unnamed protein product [Ascophyllum nodosum]
MLDMGRSVSTVALTGVTLLHLLAYQGSALRNCQWKNGWTAASALQRAAPSCVHGRCSPMAQRTSPQAGLDQDSTPLVDALEETATKVRSPLFYPGHKLGSGAPSRFVDIILGGKLEALRHDLPELPELDNLFAPEGAIRDAEALAAEAFGAARTWLLTNGSTCGVLASIIACVQWHNSRLQPVGAVVQSNRAVDPRDLGTGAGALTQPVQPPPLLRRSVVILPRDAHKSAVHALVLSGATPCFLPPLRHPKSGIGLGISRVSLEAALVEHGEEVAAVLVVSPTYEGACFDVESISNICHAAGVPLVVDEAHGAHLAFLEEEDGRSEFPKAERSTPSSVSPTRQGRDENRSTGRSIQRSCNGCGADLVVQSAHKTLGSLTQSALLHLGHGEFVSGGPGSDSLPQEASVSAALATVQSSSPSYLLLSSLDAARWSLAGGAKEGKRRLEGAVRIVRRVREELSSVQGIDVVDLEGEEGREAGFVGMDPLRLTVSFNGGLGAYDVDDWLTEEFGVYSELPTPEYITFVFGPGSTIEHGRTLTDALRQVVGKATSRQAAASSDHVSLDSSVPTTRPAVSPRQLCTPREAFFRPSRPVAAGDAVGLASAETVCPYPPGIPALLPGEEITQEALDLLVTVKGAGGFVSGCADASLATIRVVGEPLC